MAVQVKVKGKFKNSYRFLTFVNKWKVDRVLQQYAERGLTALVTATPINSGKTASSWGYTVESSLNGAAITWTNTNINDGVNIAVILQYGHGTGTGGYVQGVDYINPALVPVFEEIANELWREVTTA